jgi:hypothetical protein
MPWPPETLLHGKHVHGAALALGIAAAAPGQFGHHALGVHAAGQHVAMIAVPGDDLVALLQGHLHAHDDGFLPDIEVAKAADQPHAVHLAGLLLEAADQQHIAIGGKLLLPGKFGGRGRGFGGRCRLLGYGHRDSLALPARLSTIDITYPNSRAD